MRSPRSLAIFGLLSTACVLSACGSSNKAAAVASASAEHSTAQIGLEYSRCMRSHGLPGFPDPSATGQIELGASSGVNPQSPAFQAAQQACRRYAPLKGGPPTMTAGQRRAALRFAECMRAHGQSGFPDPTLTPPPGTTHVLVLQGMVFAFSSDGIDPKSPAFRQAAAKCGVTPPGGAPSPGGALS